MNLLSVDWWLLADAAAVAETLTGGLYQSAKLQVEEVCVADSLTHRERSPTVVLRRDETPHQIERNDGLIPARSQPSEVGGGSLGSREWGGESLEVRSGETSIHPIGEIDTSNRRDIDTPNRGDIDTSNRGDIDTSNRGDIGTSNRGDIDTRQIS
ncbi:hypothetical protein ElyMa_006704000 [Elysia marginata]|uniref:Uncharacterized protein n=1 Tax=Elysia marginata TaxID=1093978 RepID=A0AAV4IQK9_9GAST|nr:hypothetical protein ElyMa_006704000 [Elysia marginata]